MEHSDSQTPNTPVAKHRGAGGDVQSKGIFIPDDDDADGREKAGGEAPPESSSGEKAEQ